MKVHRSFAPLILIFTLLLAACGSAAPATQSPATSAPAPAAEAPATEAPTQAPAQEQPTSAPAEQPAEEPTLVPTKAPETSTVGSGSTKIVWWHISTVEDQRDNWQNLANQFVAENPNVSIEITVLENEAFKSKIATAMQSGSPPDIFQTWGGGVLKQYAEAGLVQDITPALQQNGWGDSFHQGPLSMFAFDGKNYGVPWNAGMIGFWYNKDLFQQAGIEQPPATWDELLEDVNKLKAAGITPIALGEKDKWPGHFYWVYLAMRLGGEEAFLRAYSREGGFADQPYLEAAQRLKDLIDLEPFQTGYLGAGYGDQQVVMGNAKAAMELMGQWAPGSNRSVAEDLDAYNNSLGWFPFPAVEGGVGKATDALGGGDGFAIGKNAAPEAIEFVRFLTSVEVQTEMARNGFALPPTVKGAEAGVDDPLILGLLDNMSKSEYYQLYYDQYLPPALGQVINDATQELFAGTRSPEEVVAQIEEAASFELQP